MPRSTITDTVNKVQSLITQLYALTDDERAYFFDMVDPLPEQPEAPVKKTRKKRTTKAPASPKKRGMPANVGQSIAEGVKSAGNDLEDEACARCPNRPDHNIHHLAGFEGYHEFKSAA